MGDDGTLPRDANGSTALPILIRKDCRSKSIGARPVATKATEDQYAAKAIMTFLDQVGYKRIVLKSDQEPAMLSLKRAVAVARRAET